MNLRSIPKTRLNKVMDNYGDNQGSTRNVINKLRNDNEAKKFEAGKYEEKYDALQRQLSEAVEPSRKRAIELYTRKATRAAELKAAFESRLSSRNEEMDHVANLLASLKIQRQNRREVVQQNHREKLALIKKKAEVYQKIAALVRIANKIKSGKSAQDAIAALKVDNQQKKVKLEDLKEKLDQQNLASNELRQKVEALRSQLANQSGVENAMNKVAELQAEVMRLDKRELYLQNEAKNLENGGNLVSEKEPQNCVNDSGYNDSP